MSPEITLLSPSIQRLLKSFLSGRNANTLNAYRTDLSDFTHFIKASDAMTAISNLISLGHGEANMTVLDYRNDLIKRGLQSASVNRKLSSLRAIIKLARMGGLIPWALEVPNLKTQPYRDTKGVGISGVDNVLNSLRVRDDERALRDIAIIRLFYDIGLRVSEAVRLDLSDLYLADGQIEILGKGRTQKEKLNIPETTVEALKAWLLVRKNHESQAVFLNFDRAKKGSGRITRSGVLKVIRRLGLDHDLTLRCHSLRHDSINAAIRVAQENGISLPSVLQFTRHKNLATLQVYVDNFTNRQGEIANLVSLTIGKKSIL